VALNFTQMFDACAQAQADGLLPPRRVPTVQVRSCLTVLQDMCWLMAHPGHYRLQRST
jgi:hypothetical protein